MQTDAIWSFLTFFFFFFLKNQPSGLYLLLFLFIKQLVVLFLLPQACGSPDPDTLFYP